MNTAAKVLKVDLSIQLILLTILLGSLLGAALFKDSSYMIWYLTSLGIIGIWQLLSALLIGCIYKDSTRFSYLLGVLIYLLSIGFIGGWLSSIGFAKEICKDVLIFGIPTLIALWYAYHTYFDIKKINNYPRSFWDLT